MGRRPTITLEDVSRARRKLIEAGAAHGIIAIRTEIGHGSPQLIAKYVREIESLTSSPTVEKLPDSVLESVDRVWQTIWQEAGSHIAQAEQSTQETLNRTMEQTETLSSRLAEVESSLQTSQQALAAQQQANAALEKELLEKNTQLSSQNQHLNYLEKQLMQQQELFDTWRKEQTNERQLLKSQLEALEIAGRERSARKRKSRGEQMDLYRDQDT